MSGSKLTEEVLRNLEIFHSDPPLCRLCGGALTPGGTGYPYHCSSDDASPIRSTLPRKEQQAHWDASLIWNPRSDPWIIDLIAEVRNLRAQLEKRA